MAPPIAQRFERHVQAHLVAELEAVGDGLGCIEHRHLDAVDPVSIDALDEGRSGHADDANRRLGEPRHGRTVGDSQPYLVRCLCADAVHAQCREQADHPAGHADRHLGKRVVLGDRLAREAVQATPDAHQFAGGHEPGQRDGGQSRLREIARAQQLALSSELEDGHFIGNGRFHVGSLLQIIGTSQELPLYCNRRDDK